AALLVEIAVIAARVLREDVEKASKRIDESAPGQRQIADERISRRTERKAEPSPRGRRARRGDNRADQAHGGVSLCGLRFGNSRLAAHEVVDGLRLRHRHVGGERVGEARSCYGYLVEPGEYESAFAGGTGSTLDVALRDQRDDDLVFQSPEAHPKGRAL